MPEPTIDELLGWLEITVKMAEKVTIDKQSPAMHHAIRAILKQHRDPDMLFLSEAGVMSIGLECIRAFVERVEKHVGVPWTEDYVGRFYIAIKEELAAMEAECTT